MDDIALRASDHVLEVIFSYLDLHTLRNCSLVCKRWYRFLNDENNDVWRMHCIRKLAQEALSSDLLSSVPTYKSKLRAFYHAWNPNDCSRNIYIKPNGFTLHRLVPGDNCPPRASRSSEAKPPSVLFTRTYLESDPYRLQSDITFRCNIKTSCQLRRIRRGYERGDSIIFFCKTMQLGICLFGSAPGSYSQVYL